MDDGGRVSEQTEVPWFDSPPDAHLAWPERSSEGYLHFYGPDGERAVIPVTEGPSREAPQRGPVWHIEVADGVATVSPSVHFVGHWHSPNPVQFRLVEATPDA
jgi:hypothetical protein